MLHEPDQGLGSGSNFKLPWQVLNFCTSAHSNNPGIRAKTTVKSITLEQVDKDCPAGYRCLSGAGICMTNDFASGVNCRPQAPSLTKWRLATCPTAGPRQLASRAIIRRTGITSVVDFITVRAPAAAEPPGRSRGLSRSARARKVGRRAEPVAIPASPSRTAGRSWLCIYVMMPSPDNKQQ